MCELLPQPYHLNMEVDIVNLVSKHTGFDCCLLAEMFFVLTVGYMSHIGTEPREYEIQYFFGYKTEFFFLPKTIPKI